MINQKLENNLTAISDFKQLLLQSKHEIDEVESGKFTKQEAEQKKLFFQTVLKQIKTILLGFEDAKQSIKLVSNKNS